ncbi:hypothetical protein Q428_06375 [Fervidicella metallireducens AeB]|uniref:Transposase IS200-like domain-containing protein n=1 Tax=Fervidicella metallireducens AeB TaxID=1403537 RepID=A0A017RVW1_9CLOT|nr:transposase [Fervidicella metallireducens]EYE88751.1 hypothetical protein Q428_06375 [Fervidicella metallireducens AeB]
MPRVARVKDNYSINYIVVKGTSDAPLFRDENDMVEYLELLKKYKDVYGFKIYAYCIMREYGHFIINPCGADISNIMSSINIGYSGKYNRKYNRHGHVFYERFRSKIVKDDLELKALTLYIHNSPSQLETYEEHPEKYEYSSLGLYIGARDDFDLVDKEFVMEFIGESTKARKKYLELVSQYDAEKIIQEMETFSKISNERYYAKEASVQINIEDILDFISNHTGVSRLRLHSKYIKESKDIRAITAFILKNYYHLKNDEICKILGDISSSKVSKMFLEGLKLVEENKEYNYLVEELRKKFII